MANKAKRVFRKATPQERDRIVELQETLDSERPEIELRARQVKQAYGAALTAIRKLRAERERLGLSLADIQKLTGMQRETLCKLENDDEPNPTIRSLMRYADALNLDMTISFVERSSSAPS
jgi:DNA-binding XRE family transcriptional regulator